MQKIFSVFLFTILLVGAGCAAKPAAEYISPEKQQMMDAKENSDQVGGYPEAVPGGEQEIKTDVNIGNQTEAEKAKEYNKKVFTGEIIAGTYSPLLAFNTADYAKAVSSGKLVVLYFHTSGNVQSEKDFSQLAAAFNDIQDNGTIGFRVLLDDANAKAVVDQFRGSVQMKVFLKGKSVIRSFTESWTAGQYKKEMLLQTK